MSKAAFDKIAIGLEDAIAFAGGDKTKGRVAAPSDGRAGSDQQVTGRARIDLSSAGRPIRN